jgi:hypothetical protein
MFEQGVIPREGLETDLAGKILEAGMAPNMTDQI